MEVNVTRYTVSLYRVRKSSAEDFFFFFKGTVLLRRCGADEKQPWREEEQ